MDQRSEHEKLVELAQCSAEQIDDVARIHRYCNLNEERTRRFLKSQDAVDVWRSNTVLKQRMMEDGQKLNDFKRKVVEAVGEVSDNVCWEGRMRFLRKLDLELMEMPTKTFSMTKTITFEVPTFAEVQPSDSEAEEWFEEMDLDSENEWHMIDGHVEEVY